MSNESVPPVRAATAPLENPPTDKELLNAHIEGDSSAFGTLIARHRDRLWAVALRTTGDPDEAADALQDALVSAFRRANQFRGESAVTTWLHRIVVNASLDRLRRRSIRSSVPLPDDDALGKAAATATPVGRGGVPRDPIAARETQLVIARALGELPESQREAIVLVDVEGYSVEEAAALLDCPPGTIKSRCSRGRARLAESLGFLRDSIDPDAKAEPVERNHHPPPSVGRGGGGSNPDSGSRAIEDSTGGNGSGGQ